MSAAGEDKNRILEKKKKKNLTNLGERAVKAQKERRSQKKGPLEREVRVLEPSSNTTTNEGQARMRIEKKIKFMLDSFCGVFFFKI